MLCDPGICWFQGPPLFPAIHAGLPGGIRFRPLSWSRILGLEPETDTQLQLCFLDRVARVRRKLNSLVLNSVSGGGCLPKDSAFWLVLTTVRTANRAVRFAHKPNRAQPPRFGSPHEPHRDATVRFLGGANHHGSPRFAAVRHGSQNLRCPPLFFMVRDIFSRGFHTRTNISSQFSISIYIRAKCFR